MKTKIVKNAKQWFVPDICLYWTWLTTHQGTSIFIARSEPAGHPLATYGPLLGLPCLSADALQVYSELLPGRLQKFPQPPKNQAMYFVTIPEDINTDMEELRSLPWTHELYHDGESVFWLLVWWAIHLRPCPPPQTRGPPSKIGSYIFSSLTTIDPATGTDMRDDFLSGLKKRRSWLDPEYQALEPLFQQMATQLTGDLYWAGHGGSAEMKDPEFLHEALQRIIFNFLMENHTKPFMKLQRDPSHLREVEHPIRRHAEKQVTPSRPSKRTVDSMEGAYESEAGRVSHLSLPVPVHRTYSCRCGSPLG